MSSDELKALYNCGCTHLPNLADTPISDELAAMLNEMFSTVYSLKAMPASVQKNLVQYFAETYFKAVEKGYGKQLISIDYDKPDYKMLRNLQDNVYQFSAAKNYNQLKETTKALVGDDGKLRSFRDFKKAALEVNREHVTTHLEAEYNFAVANGQMSSTWQTIQDNKDFIPNLKYLTVGDGRVREAHRQLEGVIRPVDDSFWNMYYPPNGWGCRCDVLQVTSGKLTPVESIVTPDDMPAMFKTNLAKNGLVFPPGHPYYTGVPHQVLEQAQKIQHAAVR